MKELIGFAVGAATGAAAAVLATAPEGRAFIDKVRADAEPELARAAVDLEPIARNVVRAAKLAMDDLGIATEGLRAWIAEAAAGVTPADVAAPSAEASPVPLLDAGIRRRTSRRSKSIRRAPRTASPKRPSAPIAPATHLPTGLPNPATQPHSPSRRSPVRRFLAQVVLNSLTIFVVLFLFSLLHISYTSPISGKLYDGPAFAIGTQPVLTILAFSAFLAIVEAVLRPVLLILSGRLLMRSMGLVMIAINVFLVLLTIYIAPGDFVVADPGWFWGTIIALVFTLLSGSLQIIVGVNRPHIDVSNRNAAIWRLLDRLPTPRRSKILENLRLLQVYDTVAAYGLEIGLEQTPLAGIRNRFQHLVGGADPEIARLSTPGKVRVMLQQLGPTYVKVGQMISSRAEALPPDWRDELRQAPEHGAAVPVRPGRGRARQGAGCDPRHALRHVRPRGARRGLARPGSSRHARRWHAGRRQDPAPGRPDDGHRRPRRDAGPRRCR